MKPQTEVVLKVETLAVTIRKVEIVIIPKAMKKIVNVAVFPCMHKVEIVPLWISHASLVTKLVTLQKCVETKVTLEMLVQWKQIHFRFV